MYEYSFTDGYVNIETDNGVATTYASVGSVELMLANPTLEPKLRLTYEAILAELEE